MIRCFTQYISYSLAAMHFLAKKLFTKPFSKAIARSMSTINLSGVFPPIPTIFDKNEDIDLGKMKENFDIWNQHKLAGYVVIGTNGESASLRSSEKELLVSRCSEWKRKGSLLIAGAGLETTSGTAELCNSLAHAGADALLVINPSFFRSQLNEAALYNHYSYVADHSPRPIIVYNMPACTGYDMSASLLSRLAGHPNIVGLKDSSGDVAKLATIVDNVRPEFQVLAGTGSILYPGLQLGCVGGVCAVANVLPGPTVELFHLHARGQHEAAAALQKRLIGPNGLVTRGLGVPGLKAAMEMLGMQGGPCRRPLQSLGQEQRRQIRAEFVRQGFLEN